MMSRDILRITGALLGPQTQAFGYDALYRLTSAAATGGSDGLYSESYTYDTNTGNLSSKGGVNYTYDVNHPHGVAALSNNNTFAYDANGNMTQRVVSHKTNTLVYDAENRLISVTGNKLSATFTYDADGKRVQSTINGVTTKFIGAHYEVEGTIIRKYYFAGMTRVAMRTGTSSPVYFLQDHLGSTSLTTDASGNLVAQLWFKAWGEVRYTSGTTPTKYTYTGQYSNTADFGLMYYGARWYDPVLGRFTQADSIVPAAGNPQMFDRYAYTNNNPLIYTDPSGHMACNDWNDSCGNTYKNSYSSYGKTYNNSKNNYSNNNNSSNTSPTNENKPTLPRPSNFERHNETNRNVKTKNLSNNLLTDILGNQYTPVTASAVGVLATDGLMVTFPELYPIWYFVGRMAMVISLTSTGYQAYNELNGTNKIDFFVSLGMTLVGIVPAGPDIAMAHSQFFYSIYTTWLRK